MTLRLRATRCPDCKRITTAYREGTRCPPCKRVVDDAAYAVQLAYNRERYNRRKGIAPSETEAAVRSDRAERGRLVREEAARRGVPKCVVRAEMAQRAAEGSAASAATHTADSSETAATA